MAGNDKRGFFHRIRGHVEWEALKAAYQWGGPVIYPLIYALYQKIRHLDRDWIAIGLLFGFGLVSSCLGYFLNRQSRSSVIGRVSPEPPSSNADKIAGGQAALLWHFAATARDLTKQLESTWHHWNNAGQPLIHPLDINHPENLGEGTVGFVIELRDFKVLYQHHLAYLNSEAPAFSSNVTVHGFPSNREYPAVLSDLRDHAARLDEAAQRVWDSGSTLT